MYNCDFICLFIAIFWYIEAKKQRNSMVRVTLLRRNNVLESKINPYNSRLNVKLSSELFRIKLAS